MSDSQSRRFPSRESGFGFIVMIGAHTPLSARGFSTKAHQIKRDLGDSWRVTEMAIFTLGMNRGERIVSIGNTAMGKPSGAPINRGVFNWNRHHPSRANARRAMQRGFKGNGSRDRKEEKINDYEFNAKR